MKDYDTLLNNAPAHDSPEFLQYLRDNNKVVVETLQWLVIENAKYHRPEQPWYTAFYMWTDESKMCVKNLNDRYGDWEWLKKSADKQTVKRFHIHLYKPKNVV